MNNQQKPGQGGQGVEHKNKNTLAIFAYLWLLIIIPFLTDEKNDPFVKFHLKQGLTLVAFEAIGWLLGTFIGMLPVIGWLVIWLWWLTAFVLAIMGIMNVLNEKTEELPCIGQYAKKFTF